MTPLKHAVLYHEQDELSAIVARDGANISDDDQRAMLKLAFEMGNVVTVARVARLFSHHVHLETVAVLFRRYMVAISGNRFGGGTPEGAAKRAWLQAVEGKPTPLSRDDPEFTLTSEQIKDFRWMIERLGLTSIHEAVRFVAHAA